MSDEELERAMQRVLMDVLKLEWENVPEQESTFKPSVRHQRQIKAMLADPLKWAKKRSRPVWKKVVQRAAVVLLVVSLSFGGVMAVSPTARAAVVRWVTEWYETHVVYRHTGEDIVSELPRFEVSELPSGYTEVEDGRIELPEFGKVSYQNKSKKTISLKYVYMQQGTATFANTDGVEAHEITINGHAGYVFVSDDLENYHNTVTWFDEQRNLQFTLNAYFDVPYIVHIAESVSLCKTTN